MGSDIPTLNPTYVGALKPVSELDPDLRRPVDLKASGAKWRTQVLAAAVGIYLPLDLVRISSALLCCATIWMRMAAAIRV